MSDSESDELNTKHHTSNHLVELCSKNNTKKILEYLDNNVTTPDLDCLKIVCRNCNVKAFYKILKFNVNPDMECLHNLCMGLNADNIQSASIANCFKKILKCEIIPDLTSIKIILKNKDILDKSSNILNILITNNNILDIECTKLIMKSPHLLIMMLPQLKKVNVDCFEMLSSGQYVTKQIIIHKFCKIGLELNIELLKIACSYRGNDELICYILDKNIKPTDECLELACKFPGNFESIIKMIKMNIDFGYYDFMNQCKYTNRKVILTFLDYGIIPDLDCLEILTRNSKHKDSIVKIIDIFKIIPNVKCLRNVAIWNKDNITIINKMLNLGIIPDYSCLPYNSNMELFQLILDNICNKQTLFEDIFHKLEPEIGIILFDKLIECNYIPSLKLIEQVLFSCKNRKYVDILMNIDFRFSQICLEKICCYYDVESYIAKMINSGINPTIECLLNATNLNNNDYIIIQLMDVKINENIKRYFSSIKPDFLITTVLKNKLKPTYQCLLNACHHTHNNLSVLYMIQTGIKPTIECLKSIEKNKYHSNIIRETIRNLN